MRIRSACMPKNNAVSVASHCFIKEAHLGLITEFSCSEVKSQAEPWTAGCRPQVKSRMRIRSACMPKNNAVSVASHCFIKEAHLGLITAFSCSEVKSQAEPWT